jgi:hypothetical protein
MQEAFSSWAAAAASRTLATLNPKLVVATVVPAHRHETGFSDGRNMS